MDRYNCARASPTRNSSVLRSLARRQPARMTRRSSKARAQRTLKNHRQRSVGVADDSTGGSWTDASSFQRRKIDPKGVTMGSQGPTASSSIAATTTIAVRAFSKTIAVTYVGLGIFGVILLITSLYDLRLAVASRSPLLLIPCAVLLSLVIGFISVVLALHQRRNWARYAAVSFWLLCLIWTAFTIGRNGLHPEPARGPLQYSNAEQLAGARFAALVIPYFMAILESTAIYCLLRKANVRNQFGRPRQRDFKT
jgi:hypothetical protein